MEIPRRGSINELKMSDLEEDITDSTPCDKVRYCSNCKQPCKGHDGPTGRNCKYKITEHIPTITGAESQPLKKCLIDQMRKNSLGLDAIHAGDPRKNVGKVG